MKRLNLVGQRFGFLTVLSQKAANGKRIAWLCQCDCGKQSIAITERLRSGKTRSCGHLSAGRKPTHGKRASREYAIWSSMLARCYNPRNKSYPRYGGRGIVVSDEFRSFVGFYATMGNCPAGMSLERIDNNGLYSSANCRWATPKEQARNTRRNRLYRLGDRSQCLAAWTEELGLDKDAIARRIQRGWSIERALSTPSLRKLWNGSLRVPRQQTIE